MSIVQTVLIKINIIVNPATAHVNTNADKTIIASIQSETV